MSQWSKSTIRQMLTSADKGGGVCLMLKSLKKCRKIALKYGLLSNWSWHINKFDQIICFLSTKIGYSGWGRHKTCSQNWRGNGRGDWANADIADKWGRGGWGNADIGWQRGEGGVAWEMLKMVDKGRSGKGWGLDPPIFGWHNLWTAPMYSEIFQQFKWMGL